jgi:hypothetical protein
MPNLLFELDRLRVILENKGIDRNAVEHIVENARIEIQQAFSEQGSAAMNNAIEAGVEKRSSDFINDLQLDRMNFELTTRSGDLSFTEPPYPMLSKLLKNAKPMKDGSGVYKVIPVGTPGKNRPKVSDNIYDAQKQINAERIESAKAAYSAVSPRGSKTQFRTATSKQPNTMWTKPAKTSDFTEEVRGINSELHSSMDELIRNIIQDYEDNF